MRCFGVTVQHMAEQRVGEGHDYDNIAEHERRMMSGDAGVQIGPITWSRDELHWRNDAHTATATAGSPAECQRRLPLTEYGTGNTVTYQ